MKIILWIGIILVIVLIILAVVALLGMWNFDRQMKSEADALLDASQPPSDDVITEADLADLPEPVQRYMRFSGVVGKRPIRNALVMQRGGFRTAPDTAWLPFTAQEAYSTQPAGFIWRARISMASLPILTVRDYYRDGEGGILAKIGGLVTMADEQANEASLMRFFNEMMWMPTAYLADNVNWEAVDNNSAERYHDRPWHVGHCAIHL